MEYLKIKDLSALDRPREKLIEKGPSSLTDAELIGILISSGSKNMSAVALAQRILSHNNNDLNELAKQSIKDLQKFKGIGKAKAVTIVSALELARRKKYQVTQQSIINTSQSAYEAIYPSLADKTTEEFWILLLTKSNKLIKKCLVSNGGLTNTIADPKVIFKIALQYNAPYMIIIHNHPSENPNPSEEDIKMTNKLIKVAKLLDLSIIDHIIFTNNAYFSFADENLMNQT